MAVAYYDNKFQFHYGTIKSQNPFWMGATPMYFNSIMVRLKVDMLMFSMKVYLNFNSIMVRLKVSPKPTPQKRKRHFNSIMVRLKGSQNRYRCLYQSFQFHYGTIKSDIGNPCLDQCFDFNSIMVRLKAVWAWGGMGGKYIISIPLWYD